ncbi:MAG TPA: hypothetical protein VF872_05150 [Gaiellaceae bacterium]
MLLQLNAKALLREPSVVVRSRVISLHERDLDENGACWSKNAPNLAQCLPRVTDVFENGLEENSIEDGVPER